MVLVVVVVVAALWAIVGAAVCVAVGFSIGRVEALRASVPAEAQP